jgi:DNA-binding cell septation regulator SpoVG
MRATGIRILRPMMEIQIPNHVRCFNVIKICRRFESTSEIHIGSPEKNGHELTYYQLCHSNTSLREKLQSDIEKRFKNQENFEL